MITKVRKLYASGTSTTNAAAQIDILRDGIIHGLLFSVRMATTTDGSSARWELSFASTSQLATNDTVGPIASVALTYEIATSGGMDLAKVVPITGLAIPVRSGDRLYIHSLVTGTLTSNDCNVYVYCGEK